MSPKVQKDRDVRGAASDVAMTAHLDVVLELLDDYVAEFGVG
jgi:hypothetical protein